MRMRRFLPCVVLLAALVRADAANEDPPSPKNSLQQWAQSLLHAKLDQTLAFYEDSEDVVAIQSTGRVCKGISQIRKEYQAAFDEVLFQNVALQSLSVRQRGDVAWATCEFRADTVRKLDQSEWILHVRSSFVLQRSGDAWKIVLEHFSPIADVPRVRPRKQD